MLKRNFIPVFIILIICLFVMKPGIVSEGVFNGLKIWVNNMIPYLLPMSILSNILLQYNFLYRISEKLSFLSNKIFNSKYAFIPYFISFVVGYPSGAMTVNTMASFKRIDSSEANALMVFTNNCSFQFMAGAVSFSMLGDLKLAKYIAIPHLLGALLIGIIIKKGSISTAFTKEKKHKYISFYDAFNSSIYKSITSILSIGGVIVIFSVFSNFFDNLLISVSKYLPLSINLSDIIHSVLTGILEISNGCSVTASSVLPLDVKLIIINFLISFSGISVIFQTIAVANDFDFKISNYVFYRAIQGILSVIICIGMLILS
jgi:sporulation integral membrane protein YlbJ